MPISRLPGLIDVHAHFREPGATHKEDFYTGSRAAVKGGFTYVLDMPNNPQPTVSIERLREKIKLADEKSLCSIGFHYGTNGQNTDTFVEASMHPRIFGLKVYCNHTTGEMLIEDPAVLENIFKNWNSNKPILVHAEGKQLAMTIFLSELYKRRLHVCHISLMEEVEMVRRAKKRKMQITAGVCPHHLYLTDADCNRMGSLAMMKPPLETIADQSALWQGLQEGIIDLVETDHAPHTLEEKEKKPPPFGVPGLETALGLVAKAVNDKKLRFEDIQKLMHDNPKRIFNVPNQPNTYIEVDFSKSYTVGNGGFETKCGWSPFTGWELPGVMQRVVVNGVLRLENGKFILHA